MTTIRGTTTRPIAQPVKTHATTETQPSGPAMPVSGPGDAFARTGMSTSTPVPPGGLVSDAGNAMRTYFSNKTNVTTAALTGGRVGLSAAGMVLRGVPIAGNIINAASVLISTAKACVRTAALVGGDKGVDKRDVVADWGRVATDLGGVFFPPIGLAGAAASTIYTVYDAVDDNRHKTDVTPHP